MTKSTVMWDHDLWRVARGTLVFRQAHFCKGITSLRHGLSKSLFQFTKENRPVGEKKNTLRPMLIPFTSVALQDRIIFLSYWAMNVVSS